MESFDHRVLARRLDLCHFEDDAPGMVFWHPPGFALVRVLEEAVRRAYARGGYREVRTPQVLRQPVWEASGHWSHFRANMFALDADEAAALKPVSCPGHVLLYRKELRSWRDLPLRYGELGLCHRDEPGGTLHGLLRLRQFTQDDGHVFCAPDQVKAEIVRFCRDVPGFYRSFGFDALGVALSTRPAERFGDDAVWDVAEATLAEAAAEAGFSPELQPGQGAFYGPKLEFSLRDRQGRAWQCGTIQLDFVLPERFDLAYVDAAGERRRPAMLHRALFGSLERFLGVLLEHHEGRLPAWLAPVQTRVLPVADPFLDGAREVRDALAEAGVRVDLEHAESLPRRIAEAHAACVPYVVVVGARELADGRLTLRHAGESRSLGRDEALAEIARACRS
jgi:threonyl-tRNA synthetase